MTWSWFFVSPTKRGRPWKPLGIVGAAVGFGKRPRIGVVLSCLLWSTCICMAGQRTQLTVERVRKKGPAPAWIVGFCSLPKFAPPSELLLQMGLSWVEEGRERGKGGRWGVYGVCCKHVHMQNNDRFSLKTHSPDTFGKNLPVDWPYFTFSLTLISSCFKKHLQIQIAIAVKCPLTLSTSLICKGWLLD